VDVVEMSVGLRVDAEVAFGRRRVLADVAPVGLVAARVGLAAGQARVRSGAARAVAAAAGRRHLSGRRVQAVDHARVLVDAAVLLSQVNVERLAVLRAPKHAYVIHSAAGWLGSRVVSVLV